jgi:hypothetical protein
MNITNTIDTINTDIVLAVLLHLLETDRPSLKPTVKNAIKMVEEAEANGVKVLPVDADELKKILKPCDDKAFAYLYGELYHLNVLDHICA